MGSRGGQSRCGTPSTEERRKDLGGEPSLRGCDCVPSGNIRGWAPGAISVPTILQKRKETEKENKERTKCRREHRADQGPAGAGCLGVHCVFNESQQPSEKSVFIHGL